MRAAALFLAILAALLVGVPSAVLAVPPNRLEAGTADPTSGTPQTPFAFSVRYVSEAGDPAIGVTARIGPLVVPLQLSSGSLTDGTWSGSSPLPAGTWSLDFQATVSEGPGPTLAGPTLTVQGASPSPESRPGSEDPPPSASGDPALGDRSSGPAESPAAQPKASRRPERQSATPQPAPHGGNPGGAGRGTTGGTPEPAAGSDDRTSDDGRRRGGAAPVHRSPRPSVTEDGLPLGDDASPSARGDLLVLLAAIVTVATIALLGTGWLLASREREGEAAREAAAAAARSTTARVARHRRARAAANVLSDHDPVLAALGLDTPDVASDAPHGPPRGVARGAAPRPPKAPRAPR